MILSIKFLYNQMDSNLTSVVLDNKVIKVMNHSYNIDDITDMELLDKVSPFIRLITKNSLIVSNEKN